MKKLLISVLLLFGLLQTSYAQPFRWARSLSEPNKSFVTGTSIDTNGNILTLGYNQTDVMPLFGFHSSGTIFLNKRDTNGKQLWTKRFGGVACGYDMTVDAANHIIIAGSFRDSIVFGMNKLFAHNFYASFIATFTTDGDLLWLKKDTSEANSANVSVTTDKNNNIYLTGIDNDLEGFFVKYGADGKKMWKKYQTNVRTFDDIVVDDNGNIYVGGTCAPEAMFDSIAVPPAARGTGYVTFIAQYDANAKAKWLHADPFGTFTIANQLAMSSWGTLVRYRLGATLGNSRSLEVFGLDGSQRIIDTFDTDFSSFDQLLTNSLTTTKPHGVFFTTVDRDTLAVHEMRFGITPDTMFYATLIRATVIGKSLIAQAITCDANNIYLGGSFTDPQLRLGDVTVNNANNATAFENDLFLTQIKTDGSLLAVKSDHTDAHSSLALYPNPCSNILNMSSSSIDLNDATLEIQNLLGSTVMHATLNFAMQSVNVKDLVPGVYMVIIHNKGANLTARFVKE